MTDTYILDTLHRGHINNDIYIYRGHITQVAHEKRHIYIMTLPRSRQTRDIYTYLYIDYDTHMTHKR